MKPPEAVGRLGNNVPRRPSCLVAICFLLFLAVVYLEDFSCILLPRPLQLGGQQPHHRGREEDQRRRSRAFAAGETPSGCDWFAGRWVYDEAARPRYREEECPYIQPQLTCQEHGRPDTGYQHWRWQPHGCPVPDFNATFMLEMLRGKRLLFVGGSLNRGQFVSMVCLLHRVIPRDAQSMETFDSLTVFTAKEYEATVEFYWAPFLVESNSDNAIVHRVADRMVRAGSVGKHGQRWKGADIVVFNTYLWWMTGVPMKILRGPFSGDMKDVTRMETEGAYRMALRSMVRWVEKNMRDPEKTRVFFVTMSPSHEQSIQWGGEPKGNCYNQTSPIEDPAYWGTGSSRGIMRVVGQVLRRSKVPVTVLNITQLSELRKDAHTQIYKKQWSPLSPEQLADPESYADCVHWCLPGLQDTWNELLYAQLFFP